MSKGHGFFVSRKSWLRSGIPAQFARMGSTALFGAAGALMVVATAGPAAAFSVYSGSYDGQSVEINLDTTVEYSTFYRVNDPSDVLLNNVNGDEGDRDFRHGFVDNTFDVLPVFNLTYGNFGAHVSGEAYLDTSYLDKNQNNSPGTFNPISPPSNRDFTSATRNLNGQNAVLLDAFVYGGENFGANGGQTVTFKFGRQTLLWGQSLFFASDGISAGQAPLDIIKAQSLPNAQAQQIFLPVGQAVLTYQPNQTLTFQGYYQFEWEPDTFQGVGAYFSGTDLLDKGGQRLIAGSFLGSTLYLYRVKDNRPPINNGEFGFSVQAEIADYDLGLFALRYDAKAPELYFGKPFPGQGPGNVGSYYLVYPRDIQIYGASLSTTVGDANVAGEISGRRNMPLDSGVGTPAVYPGSANAGALYAKGSVVNAQVSGIYISPGIPLDPGGVSFTAEADVNHVLSVDSGRALLTPGRDNSAGAFEFVVTPAYFDVVPNVELEFPIGITYNLFGRSQFDSTQNHGTGSVSFGLTAVYRTTWTAALTYKDFLGAPNPSINSLADRGYLSFNMQHTF
jgi:hypothetical protein